MAEGHYHKDRDPDDLATARLCISVTKAEKTDISIRANRAGMSVSEYVRGAIKQRIENEE